MSASYPAPAERFATWLQMLQQAVASCSAGGALSGPLILFIWNKLSRIGKRFARLVARIEAGTFKPRRPFARKPPERTKPREASPTAQTFGWLMPLVPWVPMRRFWAGPAHQSLQHLLNEPDMQALIAAAPAEMGRILRPLCWMLGFKPPPILARPRRPAAPPSAPTAAPLPATPSPPTRPGRPAPPPLAPASPAPVPHRLHDPPQTT